MSVISRLTKLTTKPATPEHQEEYDKQTGEKADDRSLCLLLACQLENTLERAIDFGIGEQTADMRKAMYDQDGPLGTFSRKITLAAAMTLLGSISHENLRLMRHIRNAFAPAKVPITFDTEEVSDACAGLVRFNIFNPPEDVDQKPRYVTAGSLHDGLPRNHDPAEPVHRARPQVQNRRRHGENHHRWRAAIISYGGKPKKFAGLSVRPIAQINQFIRLG
jgi:hypothetical protein